MGSDGRDVMDADPSIVCDATVDPTYRCVLYWAWGGPMNGQAFSHCDEAVLHARVKG